MEDTRNMDYCGLGYIVKGVKKMKKRRSDRSSGTAAEEPVQNDRVHTLLSKLQTVEKKLEKLDRSLPMVAEGTCTVGLDGSKVKVELPGNWVEILREYEASGSRPCLEVSFMSNLNERTSTQDLTDLGSSRFTQGVTPGRNAKSCSCEKAIRKEKMFENEGTFGTISLSQGVRKQPTPLLAFSEDVTGASFVPVACDRSCPSVASKTQRASSRSELSYVSPGPLRDGSDPSTSSVASVPADCHSCGFPWKVLFDSSDSSPSHHCRVHSSLPITECVHSQNSLFEDVAPNPNVAEGSAEVQAKKRKRAGELLPAETRQAFIRETTGKSRECETHEEKTEFEGHGELQEPINEDRINSDDLELACDASPRFLLPRLDRFSTGIRRRGNVAPELSVSSTTFQTAANGHPISSLFIDEGTVLSSHPSGPLHPPRPPEVLESGSSSKPQQHDAVVENVVHCDMAAHPPGDRVEKGMLTPVSTTSSENPAVLSRNATSEELERQQLVTGFVDPLLAETPGWPEHVIEVSIQKRIQSTGHTDPPKLGSDKIEKFGMYESAGPNDRHEQDENDSDAESTTIEELINGTMMSSLLSHLARNPTSTDDNICNAISELPEKAVEIVHGSNENSIKDSSATFRPSLKRQLVMALRVENARPKNLCPGKLARALMDSKAERTRRWIEEIPQKQIAGSHTNLTRMTSLKRTRKSKKDRIKNIKNINVITSDISMRDHQMRTMVVRPEYARRHRNTSGSNRRRHSSTRHREGRSSKGKQHRSRNHSKDIGSEKSRKKTENLTGNDQSDEVIDRPLKSLLPGMCIMGALGKAKNKFRKNHEVSVSANAKDKSGCSKNKNDSSVSTKDTKNRKKLVHEYRRSHRLKTTSAKHPITMPVSQVRIVDHRHRRGITNRESMNDDEGHTSGSRFGERCRHPDCEKQRSPASFSEMLARSRATRMERTDDRRGFKQAGGSHQRHRSSSEESVIYQRLTYAKDRARERYVPSRVENVHYGRGYVLDTAPRRRNQIHDEDGTLHFKRHDHYKNRAPHHRRDYEHRLSTGQDHRHSHDYHKPKPDVRVKRRALLRESTSSDSSSEVLVISKPNTRTPIPKPRPKVDFIDAESKKKRVTLPLHLPRYAVERAEPSRFHRAYQKESHVRKHHAPLVREILKLNDQNHHLSGHVDAGARRNRKRESSESGASSESAEYSHSHYVKSAPEKSRREAMYQAHTRPKSLGNSGAPTGLRLLQRLSQRRLDSSDSKSSAGFDQINVKDFVDFLVTLSRNTVGTLTNKRKAMRLYKSYLNGEYDTAHADKGDLVSRIKKAHHRQK